MTQFGFKLSQPLGLTPDGFLASISIGISLSNLRGRNCCHSAHIIIYRGFMFIARGHKNKRVFTAPVSLGDIGVVILAICLRA